MSDAKIKITVDGAQLADATFSKLGGGVRDVGERATTAKASINGLRDSLTDLAGAVGIGLSLGAVTNFIGGTIQEASALKDLSQQTHVNVEELQVLAGAMSEFGVDADTLGKGLFTLSRKIAHGDDSIADALATMGLRLKDVAGLQGQELFLAMERGLAKLQGGLRDDTSAEIFGSRLGMAMAGAAEGIDGAIAKWREHNTVVTSESIDALDQYDEAIKRTQKSMSAMITSNIIGPAAEGFNVLTDAVERGISPWSLFTAMVKDFTNSGLRVGASTNALAKLLAETTPPDITPFLVSRGTQQTDGPNAAVPTKAMRENAEADLKMFAKVQESARDFFASENEYQYQLAKAHQAVTDAITKELEARTHLGGVIAASLPGGVDNPAGTRPINEEPLSLLDPSTLPGFESSQKMWEDIARQQAKAGQRGFGESWSSFMGNEFGQLVTGAAMGGGSVWQSLGASLGNVIGQSLGQAAGKAAFGTGGGFGGSFGASLANTLLSFGINWLFESIGHLFSDRSVHYTPPPVYQPSPLPSRSGPPAEIHIHTHSTEETAQAVVNALKLGDVAGLQTTIRRVAATG
ncbi:MAG: hypothetical protein WBD07_18280 [Vicinamibacterales bacterium]